MASQTRLSRFPGPLAAGPCKVAVVGYGTVGRSVVRNILHRTDQCLQLSAVCTRTPPKWRADQLEESINWALNFNEILQSDADIVVELIGGVSQAKELICRALESGKSVVTANKQLIAHHGSELLKLAFQHRQFLLFGASVGGGVPIIAGMEHGLSGDHIVKILGVLNGTCNYILSQIEIAGVSFGAALTQAQEHGFAEANPSEDIEGLDAQAKLAVLCRVAFGAEMSPEQIVTKSISSIENVDFQYANLLGCTIRQISQAEIRQDGIVASVEPALISKDSIVAKVTGGQNVLITSGCSGGDTIFAGNGAGGGPTATAVISDLLWIARYRAMPNQFSQTYIESRHWTVISDSEEARYLRFKVHDRPGIVAIIANALAAQGINIDSVLQLPGYEKSSLPFVMTLEPCRLSVLWEALNEISRRKFMTAAPLSMPILRKK